MQSVIINDITISLKELNDLGEVVFQSIKTPQSAVDVLNFFEGAIQELEAQGVPKCDSDTGKRLFKNFSGKYLALYEVLINGEENKSDKKAIHS